MLISILTADTKSFFSCSVAALICNAEGVHEFEPGVVATPGNEDSNPSPLKEVANDLANAYGVRECNRYLILGLKQPQAGTRERLRRLVAQTFAPSYYVVTCFPNHH